MVKVSTMVGHLQKRSGTQGGLRPGQRYINEPFLAQHRRKPIDQRIKTAKDRISSQFEVI
jgi:hypothetical protein